MAMGAMGAEAKAELVALINEKIGEHFEANFPAAAREFLLNLATEKNAILDLQGQVNRLEAGLTGALPQMASTSEELKRSHDKLQHGLDGLNRRDQEVSDKLTSQFAELDSRLANMVEQIGLQLSSVQVQANTVETMQEGISGIVAKQKEDLEKVRREVGDFVRTSLASVREQGGQAHGGEAGKRGCSLINPKESTMDCLKDGISKAAFVLWRDNLDMHLEMFENFGPGIDKLLRRVRLHPGVSPQLMWRPTHTRQLMMPTPSATTSP